MASCFLALRPSPTPVGRHPRPPLAATSHPPNGPPAGSVPAEAFRLRVPPGAARVAPRVKGRVTGRATGRVDKGLVDGVERLCTTWERERAWQSGRDRGGREGGGKEGG